MFLHANRREILVFMIGLHVICHHVCGIEQCPIGWTSDERRSRCIKAMDFQLDNSNAINSCRSCGGDLIRIEDLPDQQIATCAIEKHIDEGKNGIWGYFIDMNDKETTDVWKFENGDNVTWFYWDDGQPNGRPPAYPNGQHCMAIDTSQMKWHDQGCEMILHNVCMRSIGYEGLLENNFTETNSCLEKKAISRRFSSPVVEDCAAVCSSDPCCTDMAHGNAECTLYALHPLQTTAVCLGSSYRVFSKIIA